MPNLLTFTAAIVGVNIRLVKILAPVAIDDDNNVMTLPLIVMSASGVVMPPLPWLMTVRNGSVEGAVVAGPTPEMITKIVIPVTLTGAGVATAFDLAVAAFHNPANAADRRGAILAALKALSGVVTGSNTTLDGTTIPILPAGAVS